MKLFVGLGNPGSTYTGHRHNVGFMALDRIAADHGFAPWRSKFQGQVTEARLGSDKVLLLKPGTFMNKSGHSVAAAAQFYKLAASDIYVFHDELDLAPGKCRVKTGGGHAGHNGLRSIHGAITAAYHRIRIGIGHPGHKDLVSGYVLHDFAKADHAWLDDLLWGISDGAPHLAAGEAARFMNAVALRTAPPRASTGEKAKTVTGQKTDKGQKTGKAQDTKPKPPDPAPEAAQPAAQDDARSKLQKLIDKFR